MAINSSALRRHNTRLSIEVVTCLILLSVVSKLGTILRKTFHNLQISQNRNPTEPWNMPIATTISCTLQIRLANPTSLTFSGVSDVSTSIWRPERCALLKPVRPQWIFKWMVLSPLKNLSSSFLVWMMICSTKTILDDQTKFQFFSIFDKIHSISKAVKHKELS